MYFVSKGTALVIGCTFLSCTFLSFIYHFTILLLLFPLHLSGIEIFIGKKSICKLALTSPFLSLQSGRTSPAGSDVAILISKVKLVKNSELKSCEVKMAVLAVLTVVSCSDWKNVLGILVPKQKHHEKETAEGDLQ